MVSQVYIFLYILSLSSKPVLKCFSSSTFAGEKKNFFKKKVPIINLDQFADPLLAPLWSCPSYDIETSSRLAELDIEALNLYPDLLGNLTLVTGVHFL